jgi:hypothetical protein
VSGGEAFLPLGRDLHCTGAPSPPLVPAAPRVPNQRALCLLWRPPPRSITRTALGPHKPVVVAIPLVYFVTSLVVDYVMYWVRGFDAFTDQVGAGRAARRDAHPCALWARNVCRTPCVVG